MNAHDAVYSNGERAYAPHCNSQVLHAPGVCEFCDEYPDWQGLRKAAGASFSPTDLPWAGNRPKGYATDNDELETLVKRLSYSVANRADHSKLTKGWRCLMPNGHEGTSCAAVPKWWNVRDKFRYRRGVGY